MIFQIPDAAIFLKENHERLNKAVMYLFATFLLLVFGLLNYRSRDN
jgi:hypothetical protein